MQRYGFLILLFGLGSCGSATVGQLRFHNKAPVERVDDRMDVAKKPPSIRFVKGLYHFDGFFHKRLTRASELPEQVRAKNLNSMGEVPDSTWFTNRIGTRHMTPEEVGTGPNLSGSPELHTPWTVKSSKIGGVSVGFIIKDARGFKYLLKFDKKGAPEIETAADVIVAKILWACGYSVPEDYVVRFRRSDLVLAPDAKVKTLTGRKSPLTEKILDAQLAKIDIGDDGVIRGLVSKFVSGIPLGGHPRVGTRSGDSNDLVAVEHRRDVRGQYSIFAWLDHTDIKKDNTLDMWAEDPGDKTRHFVTHYLLDFGNSLGAQAYLGSLKSSGHAHVYDFADILGSLVTLGLWKRPWEGRTRPSLRGIGLFESASYRPDAWEAHTPSYFPFLETDRFDGYWGAKILIRFTRAHLAAVVATAKFRDPKAAAYMIETLVARQRKTAKYWFGEVAPLENFEIRGSGAEARLCFDDLAISNGFLRVPQRYRVRTFDYEGTSTGGAQLTSEAEGVFCTKGLPGAQGHDGYRIVEITALRGALRNRPVHVHMAVTPATEPSAGALRVIGIRRR